MVWRPYWRLYLLLLMIWPMAAGCTDRPAPRSEVKKEMQASASAPQSDLSDGYSLLAQLMEDEREVDMIFLVKNSPKDVAEMVNEIARFCKEGKERLAELTRGTGIKLDRTHLPKVETEAREATARTTAGRLMGSGKDFPKQLLFTQAQALNYMAHLAQVLAAREQNATRREFLKQTEENATALYGRAAGRLFE